MKIWFAVAPYVLGAFFGLLVAIVFVILPLEVYSRIHGSSVIHSLFKEGLSYGLL